MKLKKLTALLLAAAMALALVACGGGDNPPSDSDSPAAPSDSNQPSDAAPGGGSGETISLTLWGGEEDQDLLAGRVEAFKAAYPGTVKEKEVFTTWLKLARAN